jgi:hypothetical protein
MLALSLRLPLFTVAFSLPLHNFLALALLLRGTSSDYLGALSLGGSTYGAFVLATHVVASACSWLSFSCAFATSLFSFSSARALSSCNVAFSFIFFSLSLLPHLLC